MEYWIENNFGTWVRGVYPLYAQAAAPNIAFSFYKIDTRIRSQGQNENLISWLLHHYKYLPVSASGRTEEDMITDRHTAHQIPATYPEIPQNCYEDEKRKGATMEPPVIFRGGDVPVDGVMFYDKQGRKTGGITTKADKTTEDQPPQ